MEEEDNGEADEEDEGAVVEEVDEREIGGVAGDAKREGEEDENEETYAPAPIFPPFVDEDADAVESAPGDEVEGGTVPHTAEEHGVHVVDIGAKGLAVRGTEEIEEQDNSDDSYGGDGKGCNMEAEGSDEEDDGEDEIGSEP